MIVVAGGVAGCGGGSDEAVQSTTTSPTTTSAPPAGIFGREVSITAGAGSAQKPLLAEEYERHDMAGFASFWHQSYANASLKLLISALGPKTLLDHLESFKTHTQDPGARTAATQFIELIHQAYQSPGSVDTEKFIQGLQNLAPFNQRNAAGEWAFNLDGLQWSKEQDPQQFLLLFSELFRLDTLPGWSFNVNETYLHQGQERPLESAKNRFQMFQPVDLSRIKPDQPHTSNLQKLVDLLHADDEAQVRWNAGDTALTTVKVRRQVGIPDVDHFKRLTISLQGGLPTLIIFNLNDTVTLPAINQKTQQKIVLTLTGKEVITWDTSRYAARIRNHQEQWMEHLEYFVLPADSDDMKDSGRVINFTVTHIAPAP